MLALTPISFQNSSVVLYLGRLFRLWNCMKDAALCIHTHSPSPELTIL